MGTIRLLLFIQTMLFCSLPCFANCFNISQTNGKSKLYKGNDKSINKEHPKVFSFGQSRFNKCGTTIIRTLNDLDDLYARDWDDYSLKTVVLDPGHGGKDDGTSASNGAKEKNVALAIALRLGNYIKSNYPEVKVVYTRKTDVFVPLKKRAKIANDKNADLFISIHCNSFRKSQINGVETYVMGLEKAGENMEVIKRENDVVKLEEDYENQYEEYGVEKGSPLYDIIINSYQNAFLEQSLAFAQLFEEKLNGVTSRGVHQAGFMVLRRTAMPSVLVETGYLSNTHEMKKLTSKKGQDEMAYRIYRAFVDFKLTMDGKQTSFSVKPKSTTGKLRVSELPGKKKTSGSIEFGIQLAVVENKLDLQSGKWLSLRNRIVIEKSYNGQFRYLIKDFGDNYEKARKEIESLEQKGFAGSFIVAYKNERRIDLLMALSELGL